jgi:hypothetical protein
MTKIKNNYNLDDIIKIVSSYNKDTDLIQKSYAYASNYLDKSELNKCLDIAYLL